MNALEIKEKRKKLGLTQKKLAELVGVSTQTINGYENGKEIPSTKYQILDKILNSNNVDLTLNEPKLEYNSLPGYERMKNKTIDDFIKQLKDTKDISLLSSNFDDKLTIFKLYINTLEQYKISKKDHLNEK